MCGSRRSRRLPSAPRLSCSSTRSSPAASSCSWVRAAPTSASATSSSLRWIMASSRRPSTWVKVLRNHLQGILLAANSVAKNSQLKRASFFRAKDFCHCLQCDKFACNEYHLQRAISIVSVLLSDISSKIVSVTTLDYRI